MSASSLHRESTDSLSYDQDGSAPVYMTIIMKALKYKPSAHISRLESRCISHGLRILIRMHTIIRAVQLLRIVRMRM